MGERAFSYEYTVAWADTDALGIMHFSNYFKMCERAEQAFFESREVEANGIYLPRVSASCDFKSPLRFRDRALVTVTTREVGKRHIVMDYAIDNSTEGRQSAACTIVVASVDKDMRPLIIPDSVVSKLK